MSMQRIYPERQLPDHVRRVNRGLFDMFAVSRHGGEFLDPSRAVVLYNAEGFFRYALGRKPSRFMLAKLFRETPVRFWSKGV